MIEQLRRRLWLVFGLGVPLLICGVPALLLFVRARPPSAEALQAQFQAKRAPLQALVRMTQEDGAAQLCVTDEVSPRLEPDRLAEYRARLKEAEVRCLLRRKESLEFTVWAFGFPGTDAARGFTWSPEPLPNELRCIARECIPPDLKLERWERVHQRLDPEWALFAF